MSHKPFSVIAHLQTGLVLTPDAYLTLDAVLASMIFTATEGNIERAHAEIPLERTRSIWHGSAAFLDSAFRQSYSPAFKNGIAPREEMWCEAWRGKNPKRQPKGRIDTQRGPYKGGMDQYVATECGTVTWFGHGDLDAVRDLLADLRFVGKKARQGWGQIDRIDIDEVDEDLSLSFTDDNGMRHPMRPVPVAEWGDTTGRLVRSVVSAPPYFDKALAQPCVVPASRIAPWASQFS